MLAQLVAAWGKQTVEAASCNEVVSCYLLHNFDLYGVKAFKNTKNVH
jgi:hypothetical protein